LHEGAPALARAESAVAMQERRARARLMAECPRIADELRRAERGAFDHVEHARGVGIRFDRKHGAGRQRCEAERREIFVEPAGARRIAPWAPGRTQHRARQRALDVRDEGMHAQEIVPVLARIAQTLRKACVESNMRGARGTAQSIAISVVGGGGHGRTLQQCIHAAFTQLHGG
jgi:hypothetical protein